ncbi:MAG: DNA-binding protein [Rhodocyclaceae bacterium]|nr:DNA-binding protein [Rhodocyclaceae bacterium]
MARGGIYKSEVIRARTTLLSRGIYPSIDSVRQELGNTGSKATIHRFLKEIEEEEGGKTGGKVAISEALQDLVARLAERLIQEGEGRITELVAKHAEELDKLQQALSAAQAHSTAVENELLEATSEVVQEQKNHERTAERLRVESLALAKVRQQVTDLEERLAEQETHRQSLEEKHAHAREALEHFRTAAKEQREQDLRQHEQQVQYLQGEIKTLKGSLTQAQLAAADSNKENARLVGELSRAERSLHDAKAELRALQGVQTELGSAQHQVERLGRQVVELEAQVAEQKSRNQTLESARAKDQTQIQELRIELGAARAAVEAQTQLTDKIQSWLKPNPPAPVAG